VDKKRKKERKRCRPRGTNLKRKRNLGTKYDLPLQMGGLEENRPPGRVVDEKLGGEKVCLATKKKKRDGDRN